MAPFFTENTLRLLFFGGTMAVLAGWEMRFQRKQTVDSKPRRWSRNLGLATVYTLILQAGLVMLPVSFAVLAREKGMGIFNQMPLPDWANWIASLVMLDFVIYLQHVLFHFVPVLWRLHQVHHSDLDIDVTTAVRFHPIEIVISLFIKLAAVAAFGFAPSSVLAFEIILNAASMFNHANIYIPPSIDKTIRLMIVTPDMHRVHHSVVMAESNTNFGFSLSLWDRLCGTYHAQPEAGHAAMTIGLSYSRTPKTLIQLLVMPFQKQASS